MWWFLTTWVLRETPRLVIGCTWALTALSSESPISLAAIGQNGQQFCQCLLP
jgi:hypothetical protein